MENKEIFGLSIEVWNEFTEEQKTILLCIACVSLAKGFIDYIVKESKKLKK